MWKLNLLKASYTSDEFLTVGGQEKYFVRIKISICPNLQKVENQLVNNIFMAKMSFEYKFA